MAMTVRPRISPSSCSWIAASTSESGPTELRFVGVDGPRWMVRGVYQGPVATDPSAAQPLVLCMRGLVVNRGAEAKPVREPLMLRLPKEMTEAAAAAATEEPVESGEAGPRRKPSPRRRR